MQKKKKTPTLALAWINWSLWCLLGPFPCTVNQLFISSSLSASGVAGSSPRNPQLWGHHNKAVGYIPLRKGSPWSLDDIIIPDEPSRLLEIWGCCKKAGTYSKVTQHFSKANFAEGCATKVWQASTCLFLIIKNVQSFFSDIFSYLFLALPLDKRNHFFFLALACPF